MSNHIFSFLATPVFAYIHIQHQPCPYVNLQQQLFTCIQQQLYVQCYIDVHFLQPILHLFCILFINSLTQPFCLNFSTTISGSIFVFFATFHQPTTNSTFSNQPSNSNFLLSCDTWRFLLIIVLCASRQ